jgi:calmodulin
MLHEFMGVMAEAEFFYLFLDTFNALDKDNTGFVCAADLDRVLCGMRDLISQDQMSIIDVEDKDMLVDYEQFSRMMFGAKL